MYTELFQAIETKCEKIGTPVDPLVVITDFGLVAMQANRECFGDHVTTQGCFFHLTQNNRKKVQELGLIDHCCQDDAFKHFCGMVDGLAFLPVADVERGMQFLRTITPPDAESLIDYFEET